MSREINQNLYPSNGGYQFREKDGSIHHSEGWRMLEQVVKSYRIRAGMEVGNLWDEIMEQACVQNSHLCHDNAPHVLVPTSTGTNYANTMFQKVSNWISGIMTRHQRREVHLVDRAEATRRAGLCGRCPRQMAIPATCGACHSQMSTMRRAIIGGNSVNESLAGCSALGEDTKLSIHIQLEPITTDTQPDFCWRRSQ